MTVGEVIALLSTVDPSYRVIVQSPVSGADDVVRVSTCEFVDRMMGGANVTGVILETNLDKDGWAPPFGAVDPVVH